MNQRLAIAVVLSAISALLVSFSTAQGLTSSNSCQNVTCDANQECRLVQVQCFAAPCYPVPECLPACSPLTGCNRNCPNGLTKDAFGCDTCQCRVCDPDPCPGQICFYGKMKDADGCVLCPCNQPCLGMECPSGAQCKVEQNTTTNAYYGRCVGTVTNPPCPKVQCINNCPRGYASDSNGCQTCNCFALTCSAPCPIGQHCVVPADDCPPGAECRDAPMPYCTADAAVAAPTSSKAPETISPMCPPLTNCALSCSNGLVKDVNGCNTCQCVCGPDPCMGLVCMYGKMRDANGCPICPCYQPCFNVSCRIDQDCQVVQNPTTNAYVGACVDKVMKPTCAPVRCDNTCAYFFKDDSNGCQTCNCYDPCENHPCLPTEKCMMTANDCPPGAECRDSPMPYCVGLNNPSLSSSSSTTTTTAATTTTTSTPASTFERAGRGESSLLQCCIEAGISETCLPFCTTNITQLFQNYESLTGCYQYLGNFLNCASGGRSFESCCRSRGISESCVYMCSGDDQVDISNNHQVTQCILTSSLMVIDCFNSGVPDMNITDTTSTTVSSTSSVNSCLMSPDAGPCTGSYDRWYYSATSRACAVFSYGGCDGNGNNFPTQEACLSRCGAPGSICPDVMCEPHCQIVIDKFGCHTCSCVTDCFTQGCPENQQCTMIPGSCADGTNCPLVPRCVSPPDTTCDDNINCTLSCPNGWMTDSRGCAICQCKQCDVVCTVDLVCPYGRATGRDGCNTCDCYEPCQGVICQSGQCLAVMDNSTGIYLGKCFETTSVGPTQKPALCRLVPDYGLSCQANSSRWYYDTTANLCGPFQFGGCLGNDNNFQTKELCEAVCRDSTSATCGPLGCDPLPLCDYGLKTDANGCMTCQCFDPCDGMACPNGQICTSQKCSDSQMCRLPYTWQCIDTTSRPTASTTAVVKSLPINVCPLVACLMYCPLGFEKDSKGCNLCKCHDPCQNCTANQTCVTMSADCPPTSQPCPYSVVGYCVDKVVSTTTTPPSSAPTSASTTGFRCLLCMQRCTYGMLKDSRGCAVCTCYDPCQSLNCPGNGSCLVSVMCGPDEDCTPDVRYKGACPSATMSTTQTTPISTATRQKTPTPSSSVTPTPSSSARPCPPVCLIYCQYGNVKDSNGCALCQCVDPCKDVICSSTQNCIPMPQSDCVRDMCQIKYTGVCTEMTSTPHFTSSPLSTASTVKITTAHRCPGIAECDLCPYNYGKDSNGCRTCQCIDPCMTTSCGYSQTCVRVTSDPDCDGGSCWITYKGVCSGSCAQLHCDLNCGYGLAVDSGGCKQCTCRDPCVGFTCQKGYECHIKNVYYCFIGNCTDVPTGYCDVACPSMSGCSISCMYGFARDASGCKTCQCLDPCEEVSCNASDTCVVSDSPIIIGENPPEFIYGGRCMECHQTRTCKMYCQYGFSKDSNGCEVCSCYDPCQNVTCPAGQTCIGQQQFNGKYNYVSRCTASPSTTTFSTSTTTFPSQLKTTTTATIVCTMPICVGPPCTYGLSTDANGCMSCTCKSNPCEDRSCSNSNELCEAIIYCPNNYCPSTSPTVCVDQTRPCENLQMEYLTIFSGNIMTMPQLNCDSNGQFKVTQCYGQECWCVNGVGTAAMNKFDQSVNCYNGSQILLETVRIDADFDVIKSEDGWKFKQQLSQQMANLLSVDESLVTIMKYEKGSIIAEVAIASNDISTVSSIGQKLNYLKPQTFNIRYNNSTYQSQFDSGMPSSTIFPTHFPSQSATQGSDVSSSTARPDDNPTATPIFSEVSDPITSPDPKSSNPKSSNPILMIVLICVFVPIACIAIGATMWLLCTTCRDQRMIPSKPLKSGISTEVTSLEGGSEKSYSHDPKSDCKSVLDTTEA